MAKCVENSQTRYGLSGAENICVNFEGVVNGRTSKGRAVKVDEEH